MRRVQIDFGPSGGGVFVPDTCEEAASGVTGVLCNGSAIVM